MKRIEARQIAALVGKSRVAWAAGVKTEEVEAAIGKGRVSQGKWVRIRAALRALAGTERMLDRDASNAIPREETIAAILEITGGAK